MLRSLRLTYVPSGVNMPQGIHKTGRRSEKGNSKPSSSGSTASKKAPRAIYPALLSQAEREFIESWKQSVSEKSIRDADEPLDQDAVVQAYLASKLRLFQLSLEKEKAQESRSDTASTWSSHSNRS